MRVYWNFTFRDKLNDKSISVMATADINFNCEQPEFIAYIQPQNIDQIEMLDKIIGWNNITVQVLGIDGTNYILYGWRYKSCSQRWGRGNFVATILATFDRAVQQENPNTRYHSCSFTFHDIEKLFPYESFQTKFESEPDGNIQFQKSMKKICMTSIASGIKANVDSHYDGIIQSDKLYQLNVVQTKRMTIEFEKDVDLDYILEFLNRIKRYFEFVYYCEIHLMDIVLVVNKQEYTTDKIIYSQFDKDIREPRNVQEIKYYGNYDNLLNGLKGWLSIYDIYFSGIQIWLKQIYNFRVDITDLILWNSQAIEALCESNSEIYRKSKILANEIDGNEKKPKQLREPNLKNYITSLCETYGYFENLDPQFITDIKKVRDKLTHNNPKKKVSQLQLDNSLRLSRHIAQKFLCSLINLEGMPASCVLSAQLPTGEKKLL